MNKFILQCLLGFIFCLSINSSMANVEDIDSLIEAVNQGNLQLISESQLSKSLLETKNSDGLTPLHAAIINQKPEILLWLIEQGVSLQEDVALPNIKLPLIAAAAAFTPETKILEALLKRGLTFDVSINGLSIIHILSSMPLTPKHLTTMQFILDDGFPVDGKIAGFTPLHMAIQQNNLEATELLLAAGADKERLVNLPGNALDKLSPLAIAAFNNNDQILRVIIEQKVNINAQVGYGNNALYYLSFTNQGDPNINLVKLFVENGSTVSNRTIKNLSQTSEAYAYLSKIHAEESKRIEALFTAIETGDVASLEKGNYQKQDLNNKHPKYTWPLQYAIKHNKAQVVTWLINNGANIHLVEGYESAEQLALSSEFPKVMLALVQGGATFKNYNKEDWPIRGFTEALKVYLEKYPQWTFNNEAYNADDSLLHLINTQEVELLAQLVKKGADLSKIPNFKYPLNVAIELDNLALVEAIVPHIPLVAPSESSYKHPLMLALNRGNRDIIETMLAKGWQLPDFINNETLGGWISKDAAYYLKLMCQQKEFDVHNDLTKEQVLDNIEPLVEHCGLSLVGSSPTAYGMVSTALEAGEYEKVERLLSIGADINFSPEYSYTHLEMAISSSNEASLIYLLEHGASLSGINTSLLESLVNQYFNNQSTNKVFTLLKEQLNAGNDGDVRLQLSELILQQENEQLYEFVSSQELLSLEMLKPLCLEKVGAWNQQIFCYKANILDEHESQIYKLFATILGRSLFRPTENNLNSFRNIVDSGIDLDRPLSSRYGGDEPAIFQAAFRGSLAIVKILLKAGAKADVAVNDETVLTAAADGGSLDVIQLLFPENRSILDNENLQKKLLANLTQHYDKPEDISVRFDAASWLIKKGVTPDANLIFNAARQGQYSFLKWLYGHDASLFDDQDLLHDALAQAIAPYNSFVISSEHDNSYLDTLNLLALYGADPKYRTENMVLNNFNYINQALLEGSTAILDWLLMKKSNVPYDFKGLAESLLVLAEQGNLDVIDSLLSLGANPDTRLKSSQTLLIHAVSSNDYELVNLLLAHNANVNLSSEEYPTNFPLWQAIKKKQTEMVKVLITAGANVNQKQQSELGESPLMLAVNLQSTDIAKLLLSNGANHLAIDKNGVDITQRLASADDEMKELFAKVEHASTSTPMTLHVNHMQSKQKKWDSNSDGSLALYSGSDGDKSYLELWDVANQRAIRTLYTNDDYKDLFIAKFISDDRVIVSAYLEKVEVIDITSGAVIYSTGTAYQAALSPDKTKMAYSDNDKTTLIDVNTLTVTSIWNEPIKDKLQFNAAGTHILGVDNHQRVVKFNIDEGDPEYFDFYSQRQLSKPNQIEHIEEDDFLFASDSFNTIWRWNHETNSVKVHYQQPENKVKLLATSPDKKHFVTVADKNIYFWNYDQNTPIKRVELPQTFVGYSAPEQALFINNEQLILISDKQVAKLSFENESIIKFNFDAKEEIKKALVLNESTLILLTSDEIISLEVDKFAEKFRTSSNETILSGGAVSSTDFVIVTQNNSVTRYNTELAIVDKRAIQLPQSDKEIYSLDSQESLTEQGVLDQCMNRRLKLDLLTKQNVMFFVCGNIYRVDLDKHLTEAFAVSNNYWNDFTFSDSTLIAVSSASTFSDSNVSAFNVNTPSLKPELLLGEVNAGSVKYAPAIAAFNRGIAFENEDFDIEIHPSHNKAPIVLSSEVSSASERLIVSKDANWLMRHRNNYLEVWDVKDRVLKRTITHPVDITAIALSDNNESLYIGDENGVLTHINFHSGEIQYQTEYQQLAINSIQLSSNQQQLLVTSNNVQIREAKTGKRLEDIDHSGWYAEQALYHSEGTKLFIEYSQRPEQNRLVRQVKVYDLLKKEFSENFQAEQILSSSPSGQFLVAKKENGEYLTHNRISGESQVFSYVVDEGYRASQFQINEKGEVYISHVTFIDKIKFSPELSNIVIAGTKQVAESEIDFSDDLAWAVYKPNPYKLAWVDTFSNKQLGCTQTDAIIEKSVSIDVSTKGLLVTDEDNKQHYYAAQGLKCSENEPNKLLKSESIVGISQQVEPNRKYPETGISSLAVMDKNHSKIAMSKDNELRVLSLETSQVIGPIETETLIWGMSFSADGSLLALVTSQNKLVVLDSESGFEVFIANVTYDEIKSIEFSADNEHVSIVSYMSTSMTRECDPWCKDIINSVDESTQRWHISSNKLVQDTRQIMPWQLDEEKLEKVDRNGKKVELLPASPYQVIGWQYSESESSQSDDGNYFANKYLDELRIWSKNKKPIQTIKLDSIFISYVAFVKEEQFVMVVESAGNINFYKTLTGEKVLTFTLNEDETWLVRDQQGHYDSQDPGDVKYAAWISDNDPLEALPIEVFIADFFEPRLLAKVLSNETNFTSKQVTKLNRVRPSVKIEQVAANESNDTISVSVTVKEQSKLETLKGKQSTKYSGVNGVALFRNGRQIAFQATKFSAQDDVLSTKEISFDNIQLPSRNAGETIEFSAYAFNEDNVKSLTDVYSFQVPNNKQYQTTAYIVSVGINEFQNKAWNLDYAVEDADALNLGLFNALNESAKFDRVINIKLTSNHSKAKPSKNLLKAVFAGLTGQNIADEYLVLMPELKHIKRVRPNDTLIFTYAGHGYADPSGDFHLFPWDLAASDGKLLNNALLDSTINSSELENMLRDVDSDQFVMIIDACNSAASVEGRAFRPGPMGSSGLGQLAYNKKMMILTASQAEEFAIESDKLKHGLLTFSLVEEGLEALKADHLPKDSNLFAKEWFQYALNRVPDLYQEILKDDIVSTDNRGIKIVPVETKPEQKTKAKEATQKPGLFDFWRQQDMVIKRQTTRAN